MKRIRYTESDNGTLLTSPKLMAGKIWVVVYLNLKTNRLSIQNVETLRNVGEAVTFKNKAEGMKKAKTILTALGVIFTQESRTTNKDIEKTVNTLATMETTTFDGL